MTELSGSKQSTVSWRCWTMLALFVLTAAVYAFTANGQVQTTDAYQEVAVSTRMAAGRGFDLPGFEAVPAGGVRPGRDGKTYSAHDIGSSLLLYPFAILVPGAHRAGLPTEFFLFLSTFLNPLFAALSVAVFADLLIELGVTIRSSIVTALLYAFATIIWPFAHISFDVTPTACFVLVAVWALARFDRPSPQTRWAMVAGVAMAWAVMIRIDTLFAAAALSAVIVYWAWRARRELARAAAVVAAWAVPLGGAVAVYFWYNSERFGSVLNSGHRDDPNARMSGSLLRGVAGQLVSPGRGLIFYSPLVVVAAFGWCRLFRRNHLVASAAAAAVVAVVASHGALRNWSGEDTWGPRFLVPVAALAVLPLGFVVDRLARPRRRREVMAIFAISLIAAAGFGVQFVGASTQYFYAKVSDNVTSKGVSLHALYWNVSHAQIPLQARALWRGMTGSKPYLTISEGGRAPDRSAPVDWWWAQELVNQRYSTGAVAGVALCFLAAAMASVALGSIWAKAPPPGVTDVA